MKNQVSIIIPTYNERENIYDLFKRIDNSMSNYDYQIVVVDDNSPDKTWELAEKLSAIYPIKVIRRIDEKGLATAVIRGIKESDYKINVVMDSDLQHPPEKIPMLVKTIMEGSEIAIGSRFVDGGGMDDWSRIRLFISKGANFIAKTLFKDIRDIKDLQSGFFAFNKKVVNNVDLNPIGYKILLEILIMGNYSLVVEKPYVFENRKKGESKLGFSNIFNYLKHILRLSWQTKELHRFIKFCLIGGLGAVLNIGFTWFLTEKAGFYYVFSGAIGIEIGLLSNFIFNKIWTFKDSKITGAKAILKALCKDHIVRVIGIIINLLILWSLTSLIGIYYLISQSIGISIGMIWNFLGNKWFTWEEKIS